MNRKCKWISLVVMSIVTAYVAISAVTASSWISSTPLYTYRMKQASGKMNFSPATMNSFTYNTQKGCTLANNTHGYCEASPLDTVVLTCPGSTCRSTCLTFCGQHTCSYTCVDTFQCTCTPPFCPMK